MPKSTTQRRRLKEYISRAVNILDHALEYYKRTSEAFRLRGYSEYADAVEAMGGILVQQQLLLKDLASKI